MNDHTKKQCGSPSRDLFKLNHKKLHKDLWAIDLDFVLIEKYPYPDIVAAIDFKSSSADKVGFSEVIAYNALLNRGIPVFIVEGDAKSGVFEIYRYVGGCHKRPSPRLAHHASIEGWEAFGEWEKALRKSRASRFSTPGVEPCK
jgi:hypothetical protein